MAARDRSRSPPQICNGVLCNCSGTKVLVTVATGEYLHLAICPLKNLRALRQALWCLARDKGWCDLLVYPQITDLPTLFHDGLVLDDDSCLVRELPAPLRMEVPASALFKGPLFMEVPGSVLLHIEVGDALAPFPPFRMLFCKYALIRTVVAQIEDVFAWESAFNLALFWRGVQLSMDRTLQQEFMGPCMEPWTENLILNRSQVRGL